MPLPRLQKLMGHASAVITMRYMQHSPESYFAEDAARLAASLTGERATWPSVVREADGRQRILGARATTKSTTAGFGAVRRPAGRLEEVKAIE